MRCEICGGPVESRRLTCSDACASALKSLRRRERTPLLERPICPVCHCVRELPPGERPSAFKRRQTCGKDECAVAWQAIKSRASRSSRLEPRPAPVVSEEVFTLQQRGWLLARRLRGAMCGAVAFSV